MYIKSKLAKSVRLAMAFGAVSTAAFSGSTMAQEEAAQEEAVEKIAVTGSRLRRADLEGSVPITTIDRTQLEFSGQVSVSDLLRNTSFNAAGSFRPQSGSSAQGVSTVDLRGLGSERTLVLIDGRRLPKSPSTGSSADLNSIPTAIIERIEVLTQGASAVYGSDAVAGVINIITRKEFNGVEIKLGAHEIEHEGGDREEGSIIIGTSSDKGNIVGGVSWNHRDIVFQRDFPWYAPGASLYGNSFSTATDNGDGTYTDDFNVTSFPGGCNDGEGFYEVDYAASITGQRCAYNFALVSADEASTGVTSLFMNSEYEIADGWKLLSKMNWNKTDSFGRYAPVPDSPSPFAGGTGNPIPVDSPNNPTNPESAMYDPAFGPNVPVFWWHRFDALGNRDNEVENDTQNLMVMVEGEVGDFFVDFGVRRTKNKTYDIGRNYLVRTTAEAYINDGTYDLQNPSANPDSVLNAMKATISRISIYDQDEVFASAQTDLFEMGGGMSSIIFGVEWREEDYNDQYDSLSEAGAIGGSSGNSAGGGRTARAAFVETLLPVMDNLEVTLAGRYDDYSDYGDDFSPQISVRWEPMEDLVVRGGWGQGFRAPTLDILTQKDSFAADSVSDDTHCAALSLPVGCSVQINGLRTANPNLSSEQSEQLSVGIAYQPLDSLSFSLDYFDIEIEERINFFDAQELVNREAAGDPIPAGLGVERLPTGAITRIVQGYGNDGTLETSGVDLNVKYSQDLGFGDLTSSLQYSYVFDYRTDGGRNEIGDIGQPEDRGVWSNTLAVGDFNVAYNLNYIGDNAENVVDGEQIGHVGSWVTHDINVTYHTPFNSKVTLGVNNVGGKEPPLESFRGGGGSRSYNFDLYDGYGRIVYARYVQSF
ncbi:TonB-dependent receptor [Planctobacterium marinum]|uniref:TonB-dependent receptor n=1 Tax=Planctobacterium marinum TaxID=1631968 RepID=UPI001E460492|nr:TonB-dependent receptor [Planctobacterium marinum]MCC2605519.1 TonB-dependent receptor [Planctobacterium marinum]